MSSVTFDEVTKVYPNGYVGIRDLSLSIEAGELLVLVGPSGCGKSTALRMAAGLEEITGGELRIGDRVVNDLPPKDRDIAMVFQNYALYPHMSVRQNIGFALKLAKVPRSEITARVEEAAQLLQLEPWMDAKPGQLSGGQRQRVAMGRAIVRDPAVFLMDEPLSNLDAKLRVQMRTEIARLQRDLATTTIYVTHDQVEAMTMGDRVAVLRAGELQQVAHPETLYDQPDNTFVAAFTGSPSMNLVEGTLERGGADDGDALSVVIGRQRLQLPPQLLASRPALAAHVGRGVTVGIRAEAMDDAALARHDDGPLGVLEGTVVRREALGAELLVHTEIEARPVLTDDVRQVAADSDDAVVDELERQVAAGRATLVARFDTRSEVRAGDTVKLAVRTEELHFFEADSGLAVRAAT